MILAGANGHVCVSVCPVEKKMIRILQCPIGNMNIGGIENMLMQIYRHIDRTKIQFDFVVHDYEENTYEKEIVSLGGKLYRVPYISQNPRQHVKEFDKLLKEHPEYKIVHIHTTYAIMYFDARIAKKHGRKVIVHSHNSNATRLHRGIHFLLKDRQSKLADYRLGCSDIAGKWMFGKKMGYDIWKNAIDLSGLKFNLEKRKKVREHLGVTDRDLLIGNVARLSYQKNQELLIDIYDKYRKRNKDSRLILVGGGEDEPKLKEKVKSLALENHVIFTGNISNVNDYMMAMDVFCLTSRWEGFGTVMIEALAAGVTVVAPAIIDNLVKKLENVYIVDGYWDIDSWVRQICTRKSLSDLERSKCYQKIVDEGYDICVQVGSVMRYYGEISDQ